ncbi:MAG: GAF domain-containing protein [Acidobacteria bacterium]|nr:GAF domain-containing protein [Acidobacteriota bacterium]
MMKVNWFRMMFSFWCFLGWDFLVSAQSPAIGFQRFSIEQGLSSNIIQCLAQDQQGFLWLGTPDGLNKFDGYTFTVFRHDPQNPNSLSMNDVRGLLVDRTGMIWIGTSSGGLNRLNPQTGQVTRFVSDPAHPTTLSDNRVRCLALNRQGEIWVGTFGGGVNRFQPTTGEFQRFQNNPSNSSSLSDDRVISVLVDGEGVVWVGTAAGGLNRFDPHSQTFQRYQQRANDPASLGSNDIRCILPDPSGKLWIGTYQGGLNLFDPKTGKVSRFLHDPQNPASLGSNDIRAMAIDAEGTLWIGTEGAGVNSFDLRQHQFLRFQHRPSDPHSLSGNDALSVLVDQNQLIWIGTNGTGLNILSRTATKFVHLKNDPVDPSSLGGNDVRAVCQDQRRQVWIGTSDGGLSEYNSETNRFTRISTVTPKTGSPTPTRVSALACDQSNHLWIGTDGEGVILFDPVQKRVLNQFQSRADDSTSLTENRVLTLFVDHTGKCWVGTYGGGISLFDPQTRSFQAFRHNSLDAASISSDDVSAFFEDRQGKVWAGTLDGGFNRYDPQTRTFQRIPLKGAGPNRLNNHAITAILKDQSGWLWIGTLGGGIIRIDSQMKEVSPLTTRDGLPNDTVFNLMEDAQGTVWISTNFGLSRFDPKTNHFRNYTVQDGLQSNGFHRGSGARCTDETLIFGGANGFNLIYPTRLKDNLAIPPIVITEFRVFDKPAPFNLEGIELAYRQNFFAFEFAALSFVFPEKNQYAYRLEGFDSDWVFCGSRRYASYTNLNPGEYVFRVKGANHDGVWNEQGAALRIRIVPPWWRSWWALCGYLIGGVSLVSGGVAWRWQIVHRRQEHRLQVLRQMLESIRVINSQHSLATVLQNLAEEAGRLIGAIPVGIGLVQDRHLTFHSILKGTHWVRKDLTFECSGQTFVGRAVTITQSQIVNPMPSEPSSDLMTLFGNQAIGSAVAVPILNRGQDVVGVMVLYRTQGQPAISEADARLLESLANQAAVAIENSRLYGELGQRNQELEEKNLMIGESLAELQRLYQNEQEVSRTLQELNQMKTTFMVVTSHEIRTPLTILQGYVEALRDGYLGSLNQIQLSSLKTCEMMVERMVDGFSRILEMLKIKEGRIELNLGPVDIQTVIEQVISSMSPFLTRRRQSIHFRSGQPLWVEADYEKVYLSLSNVVLNAIKFTPDDGEMTITVFEDQDEVCIQVIDPGIGIDRTELDRIFEMFYTHQDTSTHTSGTYEFTARGAGLGLSIAKNYVELHGGRIWAESKGKGQGACFSMVFPVQARPPQSSRVQSASVNLHQSRK